MNRFAWVVLAGIILVLLGAAITLVAGLENVTRLVTGLPDWLVVAIVGGTLCAVAFTVFLTRARPTITKWLGASRRELQETPANVALVVGASPSPSPSRMVGAPPAPRPDAGPADPGRSLRLALARSPHVRRLRVTGAHLVRTLRAGRRLVAPVDPLSDPEEVARQVHAELGGDLPALLEVAERIERRHRQFARETRATGSPVRYAAAAVGAVPLAVVVVGVFTDPGYLERLLTNLTALHGGGAVLLALFAAWWLWQVSRPPFSLQPSVRRAYDQEQVLVQRLADVLERGALCAASGLDIQGALKHATSADPEGPGARLLELVTNGDVNQLSVHARESPVGRCAQALVRWLDDGATSDEALRLSAARLYLEREWALREGPPPPLMLAVPVLTCTLPAAWLLAGV